MIAEYESPKRSPSLDSPRQYGLSQGHKHLPEMQLVSGLSTPPVFAPVVADYYSGMEVTVPLFRSQLRCGAHPMAEVTECLRAHYAGSRVVHVASEADIEGMNGFMPAGCMSGRDDMLLMVLGNDERLQLVSLFDNLGKGSSGAAVQCLNLMLGLEETCGLKLA